jgi:hypothetical protein
VRYEYIEVAPNIEIWTHNGLLHRVDGPAVVEGQHETWWLYGRKHRDDGPAVMRPGAREWWSKGKLHRDFGPAVVGVGTGVGGSVSFSFYENGFTTCRSVGELLSDQFSTDFIKKAAEGISNGAYDRFLSALMSLPADFAFSSVALLLDEVRGDLVYAQTLEGHITDYEDHRQPTPSIDSGSYVFDSSGRVQSLVEYYVGWPITVTETKFEYAPDGTTSASIDVELNTPRNFKPRMPLTEYEALTRIAVEEDSTDTRWLNEKSELHRLDGPAWVSRRPDGNLNLYWYQNAKLHRNDGPAERNNVDGNDVAEAEFWYVEGQPHRLDGPAVLYHATGEEGWYRRGVKHRIGGPAITRSDGTKTWYVKDKFHNADGPAILRPDGSYEWYMFGKRHRIGGPASVDAQGNEWWYYQGKLHREGGPAATYVDGTREWWLNGLRHRDDGPAVERADATTEWWENGIQVDPPQDETPITEWWMEEGAIWL